MDFDIRVNPRHPRNPRSIVVLILAQNQLAGRYLHLSAFIRGFFMM
jgi:hypothetical protein